MRILVALIGVAALAWSLYILFPRAVEESTVPAPQGAPTMTWLYVPIEGETPHTALSLKATYPSGTVTVLEVETIEGSCNDFEDRDADVYANSQMIICYYAGLGRYYKVVENDTAYLVQRRVFEEGTPDYMPPREEFETVAQITK